MYAIFKVNPGLKKSRIHPFSWRIFVINLSLLFLVIVADYLQIAYMPPERLYTDISCGENFITLANEEKTG